MSAAPPHVVDPRDFDRPLLDTLCRLTTEIRRVAKRRDGARFLQTLLAHKRAMLYFTQPSTRTFLSFNNACHVLGVRTSEIRDASTSSEIKGETIEDSIRTFSSYVDVIIMRSWEEGLAARSAALMDRIDRPLPIINAGSGKDMHPTQALLDLYTLERSFETRGGLAGKTVGFLGDLRRGRTVRSLCYLTRHYPGVTLRFIAPEPFTIGDDIRTFLNANGVAFSETDELRGALPQLDALYVTRIQSEYDTPGERLAIDRDRFSVTTAETRLMKPDAIIMHPLPRAGELHPDVDADPRAMYWRQERNGMWMRAALLVQLFGVGDAVSDAAGSFRDV